MYRSHRALAKLVVHATVTPAAVTHQRTKACGWDGKVGGDSADNYEIGGLCFALRDPG
jgi:hypothetical protein